jgi:hypothetical protein
MSRKHNCKKTGSSSNYPKRLLARGESNVSVRMRDFVGVEKTARQGDKYGQQNRSARRS